MIQKIISGGQTGADQAALDAAIKLGISHGGWIPKGRITEHGPLPDRYKLQEMPTDSYPARTEQNIIDSDGTVNYGRVDRYCQILAKGKGTSRQTARVQVETKKFGWNYK